MYVLKIVPKSAGMLLPASPGITSEHVETRNADTIPTRRVSEIALFHEVNLLQN